MIPPDEIGEEELQGRVIYALLKPAGRLARVFGVPLHQVRDLLDMAYYQEVKGKDLKMKEAASLMGVSMSKIALLARQLKENFVNSESSLERRIEFMLWVEPLSLAKIHQVLTDASMQQVKEALARLTELGRINETSEARGSVYSLNIDQSRRVWDTWLARIDGLQNALGTVSDAVYGRFFAKEAHAFARTLSFRVRKEDLHRLQDFYENQLFTLVTELDAACQDASDEVAMGLSIFWAPYELTDQCTPPPPEK